MPITRETLGSLQSVLATRLDSSPFWSAQDLTDALNDALALLNLLCGFWKQTETLQTAPGAWDYPLSSSILYTMRVSWDGYPLASTGLFDLDNGRPAWRSETTASGGDVPTRPLLWAPLDLQSIAIWPADADGHHTLSVDGVADTPYLTYPGDTVDLDTDQIGPLLDCALHTATFKEASDRFQHTRPGYVQFLLHCAETNQALKKSAAFRRVLGLDHQRLFRPTRGGSNAAMALAVGAPGGPEAEA